jgi:hypothetical protein
LSSLSLWRTYSSILILSLSMSSACTFLIEYLTKLNLYQSLLN